jgi:hypothetical protein
MIPVEGYRGLYRDDETGAIINCNDNEYSEYIRIKKLKIKEKEEIQDLKAQLEQLKLLILSSNNKV